MRKHILVLVLLQMMIVMCVPSMELRAANKDNKQDAIEAYKVFLSQPTIRFHDLEEPIKTSECRFAIVYVDDDNIPELVIDAHEAEYIMHASGYYNLFTYHKGKMKYVDNTSDGFRYAKKSGIYVGNHYGSGTFIDWYCTLNGTKSKEVARKVVDYGMHDPADESFVPDEYFFKGNVEISEQDYDEIMKQYLKNKGITTPKFLNNTKKNRKKLH